MFVCTVMGQCSFYFHSRGEQVESRQDKPMRDGATGEMEMNLTDLHLYEGMMEDGRKGIKKTKKKRERGGMFCQESLASIHVNINPLSCHSKHIISTSYYCCFCCCCRCFYYCYCYCFGELLYVPLPAASKEVDASKCVVREMPMG